MSASIEKLFIVDVMAMAFRNFHAFGRRPLRTSQGFPTSAIFGCAVYIMKLLEEERPDYLFFATDTAEKTFRHAMFANYKANRTEMPADLALQIPAIYRMLEAWGFPLLKQGGVEADDLIGATVRQLAGPQRHCFIVSGDKDFMQLVSDEVFLFQPRKGGSNERVGKEEVWQRFSCTPQQVIDILALWGDTSDNVPGVPGIGEKGAAKLISAFGSLEGLYAHLDEIGNPRQRQTLAERKEQAFLSRQLVTIKTDIPLPVDELVGTRLDYQEALARQGILSFFSEMEFTSLSQRIKGYQKSRAGASAAGSGVFADGAEELVLGGPPRTTPKQVEEPAEPAVVKPRFYHLVQTPQNLEALVAQLRAAETFAFDTETTGLDCTSDVPVGVSFAMSPQTAYYVPLLHKHLRGLEVTQVVAALQAVFGQPEVTKVAHNLKFDLQMLANLGVKVVGPFGDSMLAAFVLNSSGKGFGLDYLAKHELGITKIPTHDLIGKKGEVSMADVALDRLVEYACEDVDCCLQLHQGFASRLEADQLQALYQDIELPLVPVLAAMEQEGIYVDSEVLNEISEKLFTEGEQLEREIYELAGETFNIHSPKQLATILFEKLAIHTKLGIKRIKKTKSGFSTDVSVLESLAEHPLPAKILAYRSVSKLKNTYVDTLPQLIREKTGRLHTQFHQTGTATGRLSSSQPNLQNIPIRSEQGREIRAAFKGMGNKVLVSADYSQIELRILAHMANDANLIAAFKSGQDIHTATAATMFKKDPSAVDANDRSKAKAINYGIIYGMGPQRLARSTGATLQEAKDFIERYFESFPGIRAYITEAIDSAEKLGYTTTITGRRRYIEGLKGDLGQLVKANARNMAVNSPIQGSAADLMKLAMLRIDARLRAKGLKSRMLIQVHDELVFECPPDEQEELMSLVKQGMEGAMTLAVPLDVEIGCGHNWLEAH